MSTILEVLPDIQVTWDDGEISSENTDAQEMAQMVWDMEGPRHYWPNPSEGWTEAMRQFYPDLKVVQMDEPVEDDLPVGTVY